MPIYSRRTSRRTSRLRYTARKRHMRHRTQRSDTLEKTLRNHPLFPDIVSAIGEMAKPQIHPAFNASYSDGTYNILICEAPNVADDDLKPLVWIRVAVESGGWNIRNLDIWETVPDILKEEYPEAKPGWGANIKETGTRKLIVRAIRNVLLI